MARSSRPRRHRPAVGTASIAYEWEEFRAQVIVTDEHTSREDLKEWQALFYGGAKACIRLICAADDPNAMVDAINEELARYGDAVRTKGTL